jgi:hypothetical protein
MTTLEKVLLAKAPFAKPANIIEGIPFRLVTVRPHGLPHSLYEELWHLNYWLQFSWADIRGESPKLPAHSTEGFPSDNDTLIETTWQKLLDEVREGLDGLAVLARDETGLRRMFRPDRSVADELTIVAAHNAYHFGRMVTLRQLLGIWSAELGDSW